MTVAKFDSKASQVRNTDRTTAVMNVLLANRDAWRLPCAFLYGKTEGADCCLYERYVPAPENPKLYATPPLSFSLAAGDAVALAGATALYTLRSAFTAAVAPLAPFAFGGIVCFEKGEFALLLHPSGAYLVALSVLVRDQGLNAGPASSARSQRSSVCSSR